MMTSWWIIGFRAASKFNFEASVSSSPALNLPFQRMYSCSSTMVKSVVVVLFVCRTLCQDTSSPTVQPSTQGPPCHRWLEGWLGAVRIRRQLRLVPQDVRRERRRVRSTSRLRRARRRLGISRISRKWSRAQATLHTAAEGRSLTAIRNQDGEGAFISLLGVKEVQKSIEEIRTKRAELHLPILAFKRRKKWTI